MTGNQILLLFNDEKTSHQLDLDFLRPAGYEVQQVADPMALNALLQDQLPEALFIEQEIPEFDILALASGLLEEYPTLSIVLFSSEYSDAQAMKVLRSGFMDYVYPPLQKDRLLKVTRRAIQRHQNLEKWVRTQTRRDTKSLRKRIDDLETLEKIGRSVTASLELDSVLKSVVDAAVELTGAEEGSLLLLEQASGELYMHAARNFREDFVRTFRMPVQDTLLGQVLSEAKPILLNEQTLHKIKTSLLVRAMMYAPILLHGQSIGILGVDNRESNATFSEYDLALITALADYAAIAINNARYYSESEIERKKLETILTRIKDGVIVIDSDKRIVLINQAARDAFRAGQEDLAGGQVLEVIQNNDLQQLINYKDPTSLKRCEISLEDGHVLNAQVTGIPEVGLVVTTQDITHLKELDRIKSEFVSTVSHDLRSPLTAIMGYTELISRVGPINAKQKEFVERVQFSVQSITSLISDLLDLGRIEAGLDASKEIVSLPSIVRYATEGAHNALANKSHKLELDVREDVLPVFGNPVQLQQMVTNLINNAIQYTPAGGHIRVSLST